MALAPPHHRITAALHQYGVGMPLLCKGPSTVLASPHRSITASQHGGSITLQCKGLSIALALLMQGMINAEPDPSQS
eukprot:1145993-Pelagomonas_calceolata.AAC.2